MTQRVRGELWPVWPAHRLLRVSPSAVVAADVEISGRAKVVDFMIDSGADLTTLGPMAANELLGENLYGDLDFNDPEYTIQIGGVGRQPVRAFLLTARITFSDEQSQEIPVQLLIAVAQPFPPPKEHHEEQERRRRARQQGLSPGLDEAEESGNWWMPNLLGRDILHHFDLQISYHTDSVVLTTVPASS